MAAHDPTAANKQVAAAFLAAIVAGNVAQCGQLLAPDARWWVQGRGDMPRSTFLASLARTVARSSARAITPGLVTAEADRVAIQAQGEFAFPEGVYANTYHYLFVMADGRIAQGFEYLDTTIAAAFFAR